MKEIVAFIKQLIKRIGKADVMGLSAQLAYFFLLSLFPFLLFLFTLIGHFPIDEDVLMDFIATYAPADIVSLINNNVSDLVNSQNSGLLSISVIGTLWSASNGVNAITKSFNKAYEVEESRSFIISRLIAIALTVAMVFVIIVALLLPVFGKEIGVYIFSFINMSEGFLDLWNMLRWVISSAVFFIVFVALYALAPNIRIRLKHVVWGAIFTTIGWQVVSLGFSYYVNNLGNFSATYGSLGTVIILMIWFYISGIIINTGGVINAMLMKNSKQEK